MNLERSLVSVADPEQREALRAALAADPGARVTLDLPLIGGFAVETSAQASDELRRLALATPGVRVLEDDPFAAWQAARKPAYAPGQVIVKFAPGTEPKALGLQVIRKFDLPAPVARAVGGELYQLRTGAGESVEATIERLSGQPGVIYAEPNYLIGPDDDERGPVVDPGPGPRAAGQRLPGDLAESQWNLRNVGQQGGTPGVDIGAARAWAIQTGKPNGQGPLITVIDSGVDYAHPDLAANMWTNPGEIPGNGVDDDGNGYVDDVHGVDVQRRTGDPMDVNGHGTHIAHVIGGVTDNGAGLAGLNWGATVAGVKMSTDSGHSDAAAAVASLLYATAIGSRITSNSWGGAAFSQALKDVMAASPALHVCAAGNSALDSDVYPTYPASFDLPNVIAVAAHDRDDQMPHFSNHGAKSVHVAAPGQAITAAIPGGKYGQMTGTSMATPHVSGVAGLLLAQYPDLTNEQLKARLMGTVVKGPAYEGRTISGGRVDAAAALRDDRIPPDSPRDLRLVQVGSNRVGLQWISPGDDGTRGLAWRYEVRVSDRPIADERAWEAATSLSGGAPAAPGTRQAVTCPIPPGAGPRTLHFAVRVRDGVGNPSPLAAVSGQVPAAHVVFADDMEGDAGRWTVQGPWGKVEAPGRGKVFTDSPKGAYGPDSDTWIASRPLDLRGVRNPVLTFAERHDLELNSDSCRVEVSDDGGRKWRELARFTGFGDWQDRRVELAGLEGKTVQVRFRLVTDGAIQKDGIHLDDVRVSGDR